MTAVVSTPTKTQGTSLLALQSVAANANVVGTEVDPTGKFGGVVFIHFGRTTTSGTSKTFAAGDLLAILGPATADATLADMGFTLVGTR